MISEDRIRGSYGIGVGILMFVGLGMFQGRVSVPIMWMLLALPMAVFVSGCAFYAKSKGYSPYFGILGFGAIPGLILLILLPDRTDTTYKETLEIQRQLQARHQARKEAKKQ